MKHVEMYRPLVSWGNRTGGGGGECGVALATPDSFFFLERIIVYVVIPNEAEHRCIHIKAWVLCFLEILTH